MPKVPINYQNSIMYKIVCKDVNITALYVGSTTNFTKRLSGHRSYCNNEKSKGHNFPVYRYIRARGGFENWSMIQIEAFPCNSKVEKECRERYWIEQLGARLNVVFPLRTQKEYYQNNIKNIRKECVCGISYTKDHKARHYKTKFHQNYTDHLRTNSPKNKPRMSCDSCEKTFRTFSKLDPFICKSCR